MITCGTISEVSNTDVPVTPIRTVRDSLAHQLSNPKLYICSIPYLPSYSFAKLVLIFEDTVPRLGVKWVWLDYEKVFISRVFSTHLFYPKTVFIEEFPH